MAGCTINHGNPYCSTYYRKIYVDVACEIGRIRDVQRVMADIKGYGPSSITAREACRRAIQDSTDRINAVKLMCARGSYRLAAQFTG